ncbi:MAG: zinc ABC transporter substrate-binding protein [Bacteroidota bacterium]
MKKVFFLSVLSFSLLALFGCKGKLAKSSSNTVFVSIQPLKYFVRFIADSAVEVKVLVPPGSSPEMFEPTPQQMAELTQAKAYFSIGLLDFEKGMEQKLKDNAQFKYVDLSQGIDLIKGECEGDHDHENESHQGHHHAVDPHIWMSAVNAKVMAKTIAQNLTDLFPERESEFNANLNRLLVHIDSVDTKVRAILAGSGQKTFVIYHPALGYYARDYGLTQLSVEQEGKSPSAKGVVELVERCRAKGIKTILSQSQFDTHNTQTIANEFGASVVKVDQLQENWAESMIFIANAIAGNVK